MRRWADLSATEQWLAVAHFLVVHDLTEQRAMRVAKIAFYPAPDDPVCFLPTLVGVEAEVHAPEDLIPRTPAALARARVFNDDLFTGQNRHDADLSQLLGPRIVRKPCPEDSE